MGIHMCAFCSPDSKRKYGKSSTGDVEFTIALHGHEYKYVVPDMILHYIHDHGYAPCADFVDVIMYGEPIEVVRMQTKSIEPPSAYLPWYTDHGYTPIGYLTTDIEKGNVPSGFLARLQELMEGAEGFPIKY